jgi:hypothetical protein
MSLVEAKDQGKIYQQGDIKAIDLAFRLGGFKFNSYKWGNETSTLSAWEIMRDPGHGNVGARNGS